MLAFWNAHVQMYYILHVCLWMCCLTGELVGCNEKQFESKVFGIFLLERSIHPSRYCCSILATLADRYGVGRGVQRLRNQYRLQ